METQPKDNIIASTVATVSSETVSFVKQDGTADAGEAAGTVVYGKFLNDKILNLLGDEIGEKSGMGIATSIVFTTGAMDSTLEVAWDYSKNSKNAQILNMISVVGAASQGSWSCHYPSGLLVVNKKTTGTSQAITSYKVRKQDAADITLSTGDLEIGAVEIKNDVTDDRAKVTTSDSDAESNTANKLQTTSRLKGYNGSTWDKLRAGITAVTSTLTGWLNVLPWAIYNASPTVRTEAQGGPLQSDTLGNLKVSESFTAVAEDNVNGVIRVKEMPSSSSAFASNLDASTVLEASSITSAVPAVLEKIEGRIDSTAPTGTYYIQTLNHTSLPADGVVTLLMAPKKIQHITGTDTNYTIDCGKYGIAANNGIIQCLSTTQATKTISGAYLFSNAFYK